MAGSHVHAKLAGTNYKVEITANGHALVADEPPSLGGTDAGASPFALVLAGLSACTVITLKMYVERKSWPVEDINAELSLHAGEPRRRIARQIKVTGALSEDQLARLREIAERTPVTLALKDGFQIDTELGG